MRIRNYNPSFTSPRWMLFLEQHTTQAALRNRTDVGVTGLVSAADAGGRESPAFLFPASVTRLRRTSLFSGRRGLPQTDLEAEVDALHDGLEGGPLLGRHRPLSMS